MSNKPEQLEPTSTESLANLWRVQANSIMRQLDYVNAYPDAPMREVKALRQCAEQLETYSAPPLGLEYSALKGMICKYIEDSAQKDRVEKIDDLIHLLNCERRLAALVPNQREHMNNRELSPAARAKLDEAKMNMCEMDLYPCMLGLNISGTVRGLITLTMVGLLLFCQR